MQRLQFLIRQRARLALEGHLLHLVPGQQRFHAVRKMKQLAAGKVTRRAATEINEARLAFADKRLVRINRQLLQHRVEIAFDGVRILVRVHAEITKVATLPAKRNVRVHPQRRVRSRSPLHGGLNFRHGFFLPKRKRRVVGDKIIADRGLGFQRRFTGRGRGGGAHYFAFVPKQYTVPSSLPMTTFPPATAGEAVIESSVS